MSLKRLLIFNKMKDQHNYSKMKEEQIEILIKSKYKDASKYLRKVCVFDLIKYSKKQNLNKDE